MTTIQQSTDHELKTAIIAEMAWMPNVQADQIGVALTDGAVTLSGQVATYPEKTAAVQAALRVRGVTAVVDEITVHHIRGEHDDADIARDAGLALDSSINVPSGSIKATVHDHVITLTGTSPWQYQRDAARRAVVSLAGVTEVHNKITLKPLFQVSPVEAQKNIAAAFVRNATLDAENVVVDVRGSEIRLTGSVSCWADRHQAEYAAWSTPGVTHVDNRVHVTP
jgi:osmotically-inducible protein OsmY